MYTLILDSKQNLSSDRRVSVLAIYILFTVAISVAPLNTKSRKDRDYEACVRKGQGKTRVEHILSLLHVGVVQREVEDRKGTDT